MRHIDSDKTEFRQPTCAVVRRYSSRLSVMKAISRKLYWKLAVLGHQLAFHNPIGRAYSRRQQRAILNQGFLESDAYAKTMLRYVEDETAFNGFTDDAEQLTDNFRYRHQLAGRILGAWRWKGLFQHRHLILPIIGAPGARGVDFGGAAGPISLNAVIVDRSSFDLFGRRLAYRSIDEAGGNFDYIFSSHALEHVTDLEPMLQALSQALAVGGCMILNLPAYTCRRWRAGIHHHRSFGDHQWTFKLSDDPLEQRLPSLLNIDALIAQFLTVESAAYCGDNSIFIIARKKR